MVEALTFEPMQSYQFAVLTYPLHIILYPFLREKYMFYSFGLSLNHIIILWLYLVYVYLRFNQGGFLYY